MRRPSGPVSAKPKMFALGRMGVGKKNKTETEYGLHLEMRRQAGEVAWYAFEGIKLRLADGTFYSPDYAVMLANGELEIHEVKGHWMDDARVKIKVAAEKFPFRFLAIRKGKRGEPQWQKEVFG